jgi:hypothetical protein
MRNLFFILFLLISTRATAPDIKVAYIPAGTPDNGFEKLVKAVLQVESGGNFYAFNPEEGATGPLQIRPIRLNDYNRRTGNNHRLEECYDLEISKEIFLYYARNTGYPNFEKIAKAWNGSGKKTIEYWKKVKRYL